MRYDDDDISTMALCVWKEARGEGQDGMAAVANVILNRARKWYNANPDPIHAAVYAKNQFTSMSVSSDPEYNLRPLADDKQYAYAMMCCRDLLYVANNPGVTAFMPDITNGGIYYADLKTAHSGWFAKNVIGQPNIHPQTAVIGKHTFFA